MKLTDRNFFITQALYSVVMHSNPQELFTYTEDFGYQLNGTVARQLAKAAVQLADITMEEAEGGDKE